MALAALCVVVAIASAFEGERLEIYPRVPGLTYEQMRTQDDGSVVGVLVPTRPDGAIDLDAAISLFDGAPFVEVEEGLTWEIVSGDDIATVNSRGEVRFTGYGRIRVRAWLGEVPSPVFPMRNVQNPHYGPWEEGGPEAPESPGPSNDQTQAAVINGIRTLEQRHNFSPVISAAASSVAIQTNGNTIMLNLSGTAFLGDSDAAAAYANRLDKTPSGGVHLSGPTVVIADGVASQIVAGGMLGPDGLLTDAGQTIVHELLHAVIDKFGIEMAEALEEALAHAFGELMANKLIDLQKQLEKAANGDASALVQQRIQALISTLLAELAEVKRKATTQSERAALDTALTLLNLDDSDGDGVPDFIEDMIDRLFPDGRPEWLERILDRKAMIDAGEPSVSWP